VEKKNGDKLKNRVKKKKMKKKCGEIKKKNN